MSTPLLRGRRARQALRRLRRARRHRARRAAGRAARPHRPERLRQEHARQLHLRHAAQRNRLACCSTAARSTVCRPTSAPISASPAASSFRGPSPACRSSTMCACRFSTPCRSAVGALRPPRELDDRCVELLRDVGLEAKARRWPRDLTQVEMRKLELARAMAAEPKLLIADEAMAGLSHSEVEDILALLRRLNEQGITGHPHRAHHARRDELLAAPRGAGLRAARSPTASPRTSSTIQRW